MKTAKSSLFCCALLVAAMAFAPGAEGRGEGPQKPGTIDETQRPELGKAGIPGERPDPADKKRGRKGPKRVGKGKDAACVRACGAEQRLCIGGAREDAKACAEQTCGAQAQARCESCAEDRSSEACAEARDEARACSVPCREPLADLGATCREETAGCIQACPDAERKDRTCVRECRRELRECRAPSRDAVRECNQGCAGLKDEAELACDADRCSSACENARAEVRSCLSDCREDSVGLDENCRSAADTCLEACPSPS